MRTRTTTTPATLALSAFCLLFALGCSSRGATRTQYVLSPVVGDAAVNGSEIGPAIAVGPVELPDYLKRPQIVTRKGAARVEASESRIWAESLEAGLIRVIVDNLAHWVPSNRVSGFLSPLAPIAEYRVAIRISAFEADASHGSVILDASWSLVEAEGGAAIASRNIRVQEPVSSESYDDIVSAYDVAVGKLSREIADAIRNAER